MTTKLMSAADVRTEAVQTNQWFSHYRAVQVLYHHINEYIGSMLLPATINFLIVSCVLSIYLVVRVKAGIPITTACSTYSVVCFVYLGTILGQMSFASSRSKEALQQKSAHMARFKYNLLMLRSCRPILVKVGIFHSVDVNVTTTAISAIITYSVSLLLAFKK